HPDGEPVGEGERFAVHADGEHRVPAVHDVLDGGAERHAVHRAGDDLVGLPSPGRRLDARLLEQVGQADADPSGVADVGAADLVGDAAEGDLALDEGPLQQLPVGELQLPPYAQAVEAQPPGVGVDLGDHQGGVDPVEAVVGGGEGR